MNIEKYVKDRIKNLKDSEVFHIGNKHFVVKKLKKRGNKYLVTNIEDPLFFSLYDSVIMTKNNLIKMLISEYER